MELFASTAAARRGRVKARGGTCQRPWRKGRSTPRTSEIDSARKKPNSDGRLKQALALSPRQPIKSSFFGRDKDTRGRHARVIEKVEFVSHEMHTWHRSEREGSGFSQSLTPSQDATENTTYERS